MFIFASFFKLKPGQFFMIIMSVIFMIPLSLLLLMLVPFIIQTLNSTPADISWNTLLGTQMSSWMQMMFKHTTFENGIPLVFQKSKLPFIIMGISFLYGLFSFCNDYLLRDYGEKIAKKLRTDIATKFLSLSFFSASQVDAGLLSSLVGSDARETQQTFTRLINSICKDGVLALVFVLWLILLDDQLFILFITILIPTILILTKTGKILKRLSKQGLQFESELLSSLLERMRGWQTIQIYKAVPFELEHFNKINQNIFHTWRRATRAKALGAPLVEWIGIVAAGLISVIALRRVFNGELSSPILMSFIITVGLLADKVNRISEQLNSAKKGIESLRRILNFLTLDLEHRDVLDLRLVHREREKLDSVEFSNLSVTNAGETCLIENLSGIFKKGDFIVMIGPSGIGKTTFLNTLLGLQKKSHGNILLNNHVVNEQTYLDFASQIGVISQDPHIFPGSILDNIFYPQKIDHPTNIQIREAKYALKNANLDLDLHAQVFGLSGGEKQRLMFARIFFNQLKLVIIDEGTSALDIQNESRILQNLKHVLKDSIIFMVSHRETAKKFATHLIDLSKYKNYA